MSNVAGDHRSMLAIVVADLEHWNVAQSRRFPDPANSRFSGFGPFWPERVFGRISARFAISSGSDFRFGDNFNQIKAKYQSFSCKLTSKIFPAKNLLQKLLLQFVVIFPSIPLIPGDPLAFFYSTIIWL